MSSAQALVTHEGWAAGLKLGFRRAAGKTLLAHRERHGPLSVQRPFYPEGGVCHLYLLHPPGGVVGGDRLEVDAKLATDCHVLVTTPGATKFYRSAGPLARQVQDLQVADGSSLEWLPQENIYFPGALARMTTRIRLHGEARLAYWEIHCLGRPAIDEAFDEGELDLGLELWRGQRPLLVERLRLDERSRLRASILGGRAVSATAIFSGADEAQLVQVRKLIQASGSGGSGATLIEDLLTVRHLGNSTEQVRKLFTAIWCALREPLLQRSAITPRIWNT